MKVILTIIATTLLTTTVAQAEPFATPGVAPLVGQIYTYTTTDTGGPADNQKAFKLSPPPAGYYMVSFKANFQNYGTAAVPVTDTCWLQLNGTNFVQATAVDNGEYLVGLSAQSPVRIVGSTHIAAFCASSASTHWSWGDIPFQVTFVSAAGETKALMHVNPNQ